MANSSASNPNPALKDLEVLVGDWEMALSQAAFLPHPSDIVKGRITFEWLEDGAFLVMRMDHNATWLMSRDDASAAYKVFYYDARRVFRIYEMSFAENVWKIWRESPGFWQHFEGQLSNDGNIISAYWEKSPDGLTWEHDFDVTYTKIE